MHLLKYLKTTMWLANLKRSDKVHDRLFLDKNIKKSYFIFVVNMKFSYLDMLSSHSTTVQKLQTKMPFIRQIW